MLVGPAPQLQVVLQGGLPFEVEVHVRNARLLLNRPPGWLANFVPETLDRQP
jgi:hypothetical protein